MAWLGVDVVLTALVGAWANVPLPESVLMALLGVLMVLTGDDTLLRSPAVVEHVRFFEAPTLLAVGAVVGFGSALMSTGGPVLLVSILLLLRTPVLGDVSVSQAVSLPGAAFSTVGYVL